jgi:hypothetical protein
MKIVKPRIFIPAMILIFIIASIYFGAGCSSDEVTNTATDVPIVNEDVSEIVARAIAVDNDGVLEELGQLVELTQDLSLAKVGKLAAVAGDPQYDSATYTWTVEVTSQYGLATGLIYAQHTHTYQYQYRNQSGEPQKEWINGLDTARTIQFQIMEGSGWCRTLNYRGQLIGASSEWIASGANTDTLTINGTCLRTGLDSLRTHDAVRTLQYQLSMTFNNIRCLRGDASEIDQQVQGELGCNFAANVAFMSGHAYGETNVVREMTVTMNQGQATIAIGDNTYESDLETGDLIEE